MPEKKNSESKEYLIAGAVLFIPLLLIGLMVYAIINLSPWLSAFGIIVVLYLLKKKR